MKSGEWRKSRIEKMKKREDEEEEKVKNRVDEE